MLTLRIYEARALAKTDTDTVFSKLMKNTGDKNLDPFFYVEYAGVRLRSKKYKGVTCNVCEKENSFVSRCKQFVDRRK